VAAEGLEATPRPVMFVSLSTEREMGTFTS
jgi:hypothetical protein